MRIKKIGAVCLSAVLLVSMLLVGNVLPAVADETTVFEANLAINKNGGGQAYIDNNTGGARDYLLERFAFYCNQEGTYFERPNVNGYVADAEGNSITASGATTTTPAFAPDTGLAMDGDQYIDYVGNGYGPMAFWGLEWNYLFCTDRNDSTIDFYRNSNWMYVKDENGDLATLKNFRAEILFLPHTATTQNTVAVVFRANEAGKVIAADETAGARQLVSIDPKNGGLFFGNSFVRNTSSHSESLGGALEKTWYVLTVEAVENTLTVTVTNSADGSVVYTTTKTLTVLDSGYIGIGGSMNGVAYRNIKITRLDKDGNAIDFNDANDGWDFGADFSGLGIYRSDYHWLMGAESAVKGYYRDNGNTDFAWLQKVNSDGSFWFLNAETNAENAYDAQMLSYLNSKFDLSFEGQGWSRTTGKPLQTQFTGHSQAGTARLALFKGQYLNAVYSSQGTDGQNNIQKALGLRPLKTDGTAWSVKNFETTFAININTAQATSAVTFYFRAQNANSFASNASASAIVFNKNGYLLFDGTGPGNKYDYNAYTAWNGGAVANMRVYVKVVDTTLTMKVTSDDGKTVYADITKTITDGNAGFLYYTLINGNNAIKGIAMNEITAPVHVCDYATPNYDATGHWNECACGEKDAVVPHEL
ncbi:MAG: hypothetical protein J6L00_04765, partial [Clostridia bacterium]|nr:hypothetical protein [Clostridia bacterium]